MNRARIVLNYDTGVSLAGAVVFALLFTISMALSRELLAITFAAATLGMLCSAGLFVVVWRIATIVDPASTEPLCDDDSVSSARARGEQDLSFHTARISNQRSVRLALLVTTLLLALLTLVGVERASQPQLIVCPF